jgi:hypothetical protein
MNIFKPKRGKVSESVGCKTGKEVARKITVVQNMISYILVDVKRRFEEPLDSIFRFVILKTHGVTPQKTLISLIQLYNVRFEVLIAVTKGPLLGCDTV